MNPFASLRTRHCADEQMDAVDLPAGRYARVLADLARVNRATLATRPSLAFLDRLFRGSAVATPLRILDVGFGQGDMLRAITRWAERRDVEVQLTGIDLNPNSAIAARAATADSSDIDWLTGDYRCLAGQGWDVVISSLVAHHMSDTQRIEFLRFMEDQAQRGWLVNDLHRHRVAFAGYPLLATVMRVDQIVRADGQLSIARSFRSAEWRTMLAEAGIHTATVRRTFPFRLIVERLR